MFCIQHYLLVILIHCRNRKLVIQLLRVPGIGAKTAMQLYKHLGIKGLGELEAAAREGRIATMPGMGAKKQEALLKSIEALHKRKEGRVLLSVGMRCGAELSEALRQAEQDLSTRTATADASGAGT